MPREFEDRPGVRAEVPLLLGIVGCSGSGKTFSALRLASGMQRVIGGDIWVVDTEHNRALNYADLFKFRHVPFSPPFGSLDYLACIRHCVSKGAKIIVVDSMTHEHSGLGGYLWEADEYIRRKTRGQSDDAAAKTAGKLSRTKWILPAEHRKALIDGIVQMGINGIFCFRASEKLADDFTLIGWEPETTSKLIYELQQQFLLTQGCDGIPKFNDATATEKRLIKTPAQFRDWFKQGQRLDENIGQKMAEWAAGKTSASSARSDAETGAALPPSSGDSAAPRKKTFAETMYALKTKDGKTFIEALGRAGFERIEDIPKGEQTHVYRFVLAEINERKAMQSA